MANISTLEILNISNINVFVSRRYKNSLKTSFYGPVNYFLYHASHYFQYIWSITFRNFTFSFKKSFQAEANFLLYF